jgi:hypothetical protein
LGALALALSKFLEEKGLHSERQCLSPTERLVYLPVQQADRQDTEWDWDIKISHIIVRNRIPYLFFKKREVPQHLTTPSAMIAILSPSKSASSMKCVVSTMVRPFLFF